MGQRPRLQMGTLFDQMEWCQEEAKEPSKAGTQVFGATRNLGDWLVQGSFTSSVWRLSLAGSLLKSVAFFLESYF